VKQGNGDLLLFFTVKKRKRWKGGLGIRGRRRMGRADGFSAL